VNGKKTKVNLASHPLRNRRFFFTVLAAVAGIFLIATAFAVLSVSHSRTRLSSTRDSLARMARLTQTAQKEKDGWNLQARDLAKKNKDVIGSINAIILAKTFSWVEFFSRLEEALPAGSFISSIAPVQAVEGKIELRFKVVSQSLNDLLALIQKLNALRFKNISVKNEATQAGQLTSEILLTYERTI
jgi:hypothetical protein